jgi:hypothetical protein
MAHTEFKLTGPVTRLAPEIRVFKDANGKETGRTRQFQVGMPGNVSFRVQEGDPLFLGFLKFIRTGTIIEMSGNVIPRPSKKQVVSSSGALEWVETIYMNLEDYEMLSYKPAELPDVFKGQEAPTDLPDIVFAEVDVVSKRGAAAPTGSQMNASALSSGVTPNVVPGGTEEVLPG